MASLGSDCNLNLMRHKDPHTAGMTVLMRKTAFLARVEVHSEDLVRGRIMAIHLLRRGRW